MQGKLVIGTEIDTSGIDDGMLDVENIIKNIEERINQKLPESLTEGLRKDLNDASQIAKQFEDKLNEYFEAYAEAGSNGVIFQSDVERITQLKQEVKDMIPLIEELTEDKIIIPGINDAVKEIPKINIGLNSVIKKVTRWGLALIGIRSIYGYIRSAMSQVTQEDQTLQNQIQYISFAIGSVLKPVVEWLINAVYKILSIFGGIIKLITGINIFAKATANNFAKANSNAGALRKTLAGFDEMNVLNESGGTGLLGGLTDLKMPDLASQVEEQVRKIKEWFKFSFPTREEVEELWQPARDMWSSIGDWLGKNVIQPMKWAWNEFAEYTKPLWQPVADAFKQAFAPLTKYIDENFISPVKEKFTNWKNDFLSKYAKFINKIIYWINTTFGMFGVNLKYIDEESAITGEDIKENIGKSLDNIKEKAEKTKTPFDKLYDSLKSLTSKTWNIVTSFTSNGLSKSTMNNWLQPLRDNLAKMGIKLPYLAKGGIINMPGRGVPIGGAIAGERGQEGIIPLTDSQQMALLGEAIGKYININATVPVYVGNRMVAREIKRINAEDNFAYNR